LHNQDVHGEKRRKDGASGRSGGNNNHRASLPKQRYFHGLLCEREGKVEKNPIFEPQSYRLDILVVLTMRGEPSQASEV